MRNMKKQALLLALAIVVGASITNGAVIFQDSLDGAGSGDLNGTSPADRGGVGADDWVADSQFNEDGSVGGSAVGSAWLPFVPVAGNIYQLNAKINVTNGGPNWISLGFAQSNKVSDVFTANGYGTVVLRHDRGSGANVEGSACLGPGSAGSAGFTTPTGEVEFDIVLDARSSVSANWTVKFFANDAPVRGPVAFGVTPAIHFVGFSKYLNAQGTIGDFQLVTISDDPQLADDFSGVGASLHGTAPDVRPGLRRAPAAGAASGCDHESRRGCRGDCS